MATASLTELNRRPSHVTRLAEREDVVIERYGRPYLKISRIDSDLDPLDAMIAAGLVRPATAIPGHFDDLPSLDLAPETAEAAYDDFMAGRDAHAY